MIVPDMDLQLTSSQKKKIILLIIPVYLCVGMLSLILVSSPFGNVSSLINAQPQNINVTKVIERVSEQSYRGQWYYLPKQASDQSSIVGNYCSMHVGFAIKNRIEYCQFQMQLFNQQYIEDGVKSYNILINESEWKTRVEKNQIQVISPQKIKASFIQLQKLKTIQNKQIQVSLSFMLRNNGDELLFQMMLDGEDGTKIKLNFQENSFFYYFNVLLFGFLIFGISFCQLIGIGYTMEELKQNEQRADQLSFWVILFCLCWNFIVGFTSLQVILKILDKMFLYIMLSSTLSFCVAFMSIFLIQTVYTYKNKDENLRKFFIILNVAVFSSYPILLIGNLSFGFLALLPLSIFIQSYEHAYNAIKPQIFSRFTWLYLYPRFLFFLYLKCYPWNLFRVETDYSLGFICVFSIFLHIVLTILQNKFGSRFVFPDFLLPKLLSYEEYNPRQSLINTQDCSICLQNVTQTVVQCQVIVKTPCNHWFHMSCLKNWIKIKDSCPQCRSKLPRF